MANNEDNWLEEYHYGRITGMGSGSAGQVGNWEYQQNQKELHKPPIIVPQEPKVSRKSNENLPENHQSAPVHHAAGKSWSNASAILGFFGGAGVMLAQPDSNLIAALIIGFISALIFGRFYKFIFVIALILLGLWLLF